ncbi:hypothetical protein BDP81DRAFT_146939, partial [Colletotrichum phormii]
VIVAAARPNLDFLDFLRYRISQDLAIVRKQILPRLYRPCTTRYRNLGSNRRHPFTLFIHCFVPTVRHSAAQLHTSSHLSIPLPSFSLKTLPLPEPRTATDATNHIRNVFPTNTTRREADGRAKANPERQGPRTSDRQAPGGTERDRSCAGAPRAGRGDRGPGGEEEDTRRGRGAREKGSGVCEAVQAAAERHLAGRHWRRRHRSRTGDWTGCWRGYIGGGCCWRCHGYSYDGAGAFGWSWHGCDTWALV